MTYAAGTQCETFETWLPTAAALIIQQARDATEERACVAAAIANAASRHCKLCVAGAAQAEADAKRYVARAADLALLAYRACYAVEIVPATEDSK